MHYLKVVNLFSTVLIKERGAIVRRDRSTEMHFGNWVWMSFCLLNLNLQYYLPLLSVTDQLVC